MQVLGILILCIRLMHSIFFISPIQQYHKGTGYDYKNSLLGHMKIKDFHVRITKLRSN